MDGHVYIRDTVEALMEAMDVRIRALGKPPRILELGCHAGVSTEWFLARWPEARIVVQDEHDDLIEIARARLAGAPVSFFVGPVETIGETFDMVVSIAKHHHLPPEYLAGVRTVLEPGGLYLLAEELCPEYCSGEHAQRVGRAEVLHIIGGYVLTSKCDVESYEAKGELPAYATELERLRQRALWRWYRFVVDYAVDREYFDIAVTELQSTHDDLITGSAAEHKFSPLIVERQFALAGFDHLSRRMIGPQDPELQSMVVYEFAAQ
jgi:SAM-dependent methyltransferase